MKSLTPIQKFLLKYEKKGFKRQQQRTLKHGRRIYLWMDESGFWSSKEYGIYVYHITGNCSAETLRECFRDYAKFYIDHDFEERDKGFFVCSDDVDKKLFSDIRKAIIDDPEIRKSIQLKTIEGIPNKESTSSVTVKHVSGSKKVPMFTTEQRERIIHSVGTRCSYPDCNERIELDIHHIVPRHEGGSNRRSNLIVLCPNHHRKADKGAIPRAD